jgi:cobyrinic acid a,c-diamide synthase
MSALSTSVKLPMLVNCKQPDKCRSLPMTITKQTVADKIAAYLHHEMTLAQLVDWAERALMDGEMAERDAQTLSSVIARIGVADMRAFGLAWNDCEDLLHKLGFSPRVEVVAA